MFLELTIAFNCYSEMVCTALPHRGHEFYLTIIADLMLSYGGTHFYTYHKLFSVSNVSPEWLSGTSDFTGGLWTVTFTTYSFKLLLKGGL